MASDLVRHSQIQCAALLRIHILVCDGAICLKKHPCLQIGTLTLGKLRELEKEAGLGPSSKKNSAAVDSGPDDIPEELTDQVQNIFYCQS